MVELWTGHILLGYTQSRNLLCWPYNPGYCNNIKSQPLCCYTSRIPPIRYNTRVGTYYLVDRTPLHCGAAVPTITSPQSNKRLTRRLRLHLHDAAYVYCYAPCILLSGCVRAVAPFSLFCLFIFFSFPFLFIFLSLLWEKSPGLPHRGLPASGI